jgi:16S rRNA G966 N2-methylase RsmD
LRTLGLEGRSRVVVGDAIAAAATPADVVLADPPYGEEPWSELLTAVRADIVVIEGNAAVGVPDWEQWRARRYGRTWVTFLRRMTATPEAM